MGQAPAVFTPAVSVSNAIAQACGIAPRGGSAGASTAAPSFDFDSAALGDADRAMLAEVARCLTEGALKGRAVTLIGRADARGEPEYNMTLGESRANAVHRYMVDLGVAKDHVVRLALLRALLHHHDLRAQPDGVDGDLRRVDRRELREPLRELAKARAHERLAFEGGLVLRVLAQVAELDGFADLVGERDVQFKAQLLRFVLQLGLERLDHGATL